MSCFHFSALVNNGAVIVWVQVFTWADVFSPVGCVLKSGTPGSCGESTFSMSYPGDIYVPYNLKTIAKKCLKLLGKCCKKYCILQRP